MLSEAKVLSSLGTTDLALVEVTNPSSAHLNCFDTVTSRYLPMRMGHQNSIATLFHGSQGKCVMFKGSRSCDAVTI